MYLYFVSLSFRQFDMFQIPVQNLDNIRRSRKKVKGILVDIGLDSCQELLQVKKKTFEKWKAFYDCIHKISEMIS